MGTLKTAVVTGAGSGVGRATAIQLVAAGWSVVLVGRREEALRETAAATGRPEACRVEACNVGRAEDVRAMASRVVAAWGGVEVLVNAAGTTVPRRALEVLERAPINAPARTGLTELAGLAANRSA